MHCNYLKYGDIVDFCYITKSFCSIKVFFFFGGGGGFDVGLFAYFGPLVQNMGCDEVKWTLYH